MSPPRVAVIGGGVAACSLAHGLRDSLASRAVSLHVFEMGRASGGRAATRGTRDDPGLRVDHGVPAFAALTPEFGALCESLVAADVLRRCDGDGSAFGVLRSSGTFEAEDAAGAPTRYRPPVGKGMNALCDGLLGGESTLANFTPGTMVTKVEPVAAQWRLTSKGGVDLGTFDWLVVSSTGLAHPRWRTTFGGEPPLVEAAAALGDTALDATLAALAPLQSKPVTAAAPSALRRSGDAPLSPSLLAASLIGCDACIRLRRGGRVGVAPLLQGAGGGATSALSRRSLGDLSALSRRSLGDLSATSVADIPPSSRRRWRRTPSSLASSSSASAKA